MWNSKVKSTRSSFSTKQAKDQMNAALQMASNELQTMQAYPSPSLADVKVNTIFAVLDYVFDTCFFNYFKIFMILMI